MKNIPNISFQSTDNTKDFEFLNVSNLFARIPSISDHNPTQPHRVTFFALLIVTQGTGTHQVDLKEYKLETGSVLKIAKGQVHAFQKNATYQGFLILFTEDFVLNYFSKSSINIISHLYNYHITPPIANDKALNQTFLHHLLEKFKVENTYAQKNIIAALLDLYFLKLERKSHHNKLQSNNAKQYHLFIQFKNLVESKYTTTRNVKDYANMLLITTKLLNQVVKHFTLNTAKSFIDEYVILEAKRAMVSTEKSLKEVAYTLGFDEVTNFTKFFKKHTRRTPKQFKTDL
ncbi:AraC family transcriptional regulator [Wenyingzhuangia aestuarii]|uniref:AraC family transcriptional regulator n=1 Tax=Wenyingzhuangia aestuarii TaxID=1647582 RepID=UPI00143B1E22|nr:helix-turn-helix transcriptional regulator [Wenyingzhuangia aestuarii]NJB81923.1 AraC-like DNA-binding protein/quercetin dioxygenase-like cupin family protein [Wenyingzhuangia aestuarii]